MAKKSEVKTFFTITDLQTKTVYEPLYKRYHQIALVAVRFRRGRRKWARAFQINWEGTVSLERFMKWLNEQNIEPGAAENKLTAELEPYLNTEVELKKMDSQ